MKPTNLILAGILLLPTLNLAHADYKNNKQCVLLGAHLATGLYNSGQYGDPQENGYYSVEGRGEGTLLKNSVDRETNFVFFSAERLSDERGKPYQVVFSDLLEKGGVSVNLLFDQQNEKCRYRWVLESSASHEYDEEYPAYTRPQRKARNQCIRLAAQQIKAVLNTNADSTEAHFQISRSGTKTRFKKGNDRQTLYSFNEIVELSDPFFPDERQVEVRFTPATGHSEGYTARLGLNVKNGVYHCNSLDISASAW